MFSRLQLKIASVLLPILFSCMIQPAQAQAPNAEFEANDTIVCIGNTVVFTDLSVPGSAAITAWNWSFGDGGVSTQQNPVYAYTSGGNFLVRLIVSDANGNSDTATHTVYVLIAQALNNIVRICAPQSTASIIALDPGIPGVTGTWFTSSTATIASPNNDTTQIGNLLSGTYLFFWVVSDGTCSDADQVTIIVDQPVNANAGPDQQICAVPGTSNLAAANPSPGTGLWTTTSTATILNPSNRNSAVSALTIPGTYTFVWTATNGVCVSRDTMNIVVSNPVPAAAGPDQQICAQAGTASLSATNPSPASGQWTTSSAATIFNPSSPSTSVTGMNSAGTYTFIWTVTSGACITRDTVIITATAIVAANAGPDQQICSLPGSTLLSANNPSPGTGLWTALGAGTIAVPTTASTPVSGLQLPGTYTFVWTITNGPCISSDTVRILVQNPAFANAGPDQTLCAASTATVSGNNPAPGTSLWLSLGSATVANPNSFTTTVNNLVAGNNSFVYVVNIGGCVSADTVTLRVDTAVIANAGPDQQICQSASLVILNGNNPSPGTGLWAKLNGGTITNPTSPSTTVTGLPPGTHRFVWTITNGACISRDTVRIVVSVQIPSNAGLDQQVCQVVPVGLSGNNPFPATGLWTTSSGAIIVSPASANTAVNNILATGTYTFVWTVTNGACVLSDTVRITIDSAAIANAGPDQQICQTTSSVTLAGNNPIPGTGLWTSLNGGVIANPTSPVTAVTGLTPGTHPFVWTITNGACISRDTVRIVVSVQIPSNAGLDQQVCQGAPVALSGNNPFPATGLWTTTSGAIIVSPASANTAVNNILATGTYTFVWTVTNGACVLRDTVRITIDSLVPANAGVDLQLCEQFTATLNASATTSGSAVWTSIGPALVSNPGQPVTTVSGLIYGNNLFVRTVTNGVCISSDTVNVRVDSLLNAQAGVDQQVCATTAVLSAGALTSGTGLWTSTSPASIANPLNPSTVVSNMNNAGTYVFIWTVSNGICTSSDTVSIEVSLPVTANAGVDQQLCGASSASLNGNTPSVGTGLWTGPSGIVINNPTAPATAVSGLPIGTSLFVWTVSNGFCNVSDTVSITVDSLEIAQAGIDQQVCINSPVALAANNPVNGIGQWQSFSGATVINPAFPNSAVSGIILPGTYTFVWTIVNGSCTSTDTVLIEAFDLIQANAGTDQSICAAAGTSLNANDPSPFSGVWTTPSSATIVNPNDPLSLVLDLNAGIYSFVWTIANGGCISADTVLVVIDSLEIAQAGPDQQICLGNALQLAANIPVFGTGQWSALGGGSVSSPANPQTTVGGISTVGTYAFVWTINNGTCISSDTVVVSVNAAVVSLAGSDQSLCVSTTGILNANDPIPGTGLWTSLGSALVNNPQVFSTNVSGLVPGVNQFVWTIDYAGCISSDTVTIVLDTVELAFAGTDQWICSDSVASLSANAPLNGTGLWTSLGTAIVDNPANAVSSVGNLQLGTNAFVWTISSGACVSADTVVLEVLPLLNADAGADQFTTSGVPVVLGGSPAASGGTGLPYSFSWNPSFGLSGASIANPSSTVNQTTTYILTVTDSAGCSVTDTVIVWINDPPQAANDTALTMEDSTLAFQVLVNDFDPNGNLDSSSVIIVAGPFHGTVVTGPGGQIIYTPSPNFFGTDSVLYVVCDSGLPVYCDSAWIVITVMPVNDAPLAVYDTASTPMDTCVQIAVLANDTDVENMLDAGTVVIVTGPSQGTVSIDSLTGVLTYCPDSGFVGLDSLVYSVCDSGFPQPVLCDTALVLINVYFNNQPPVALNDTVTVCSGDTAIITVLFNDIDPQGDSLSLTILVPPVQGSSFIDSLQNIVYAANPGSSGWDSLLYLVCDQQNPAGCDSAWVFVYIHPLPQVSLISHPVLCFGDSTGSFEVTVNPVGSYQYTWSNGDTTVIADSLAAGTYSVTVVDSNGCFVVASDTVSAPAFPLLGALTLQQLACFGDSTGVIDVQAGGGTSPYTYLWNTGSTDEDLDSLITGVYTVVITDAVGCTYTIVDSIAGPDTALTASIAVKDILCSGDSTGTMQVFISGGTPAYTFGWNNGSTADSLFQLTSGIYTVIVTDANGCTVETSDTLSALSPPIVFTDSIVQPYCLGGMAGYLQVSAAGGVGVLDYLWSTGDTMAVLDSVFAGAYQVQVSDSLGCNLIIAYNLTDTSGVYIQSPGSGFCAGDSLVLSVGNSIASSYQWFLDGNPLPGDTLPVITASLPGAYSVTVTALCGQFSDGPFLLTEYPLPLVDAGSSVTIICDQSVELTASGATAYAWSPAALCQTPAQASTEVQPPVSTMFTVIGVDANGCSALDSVLVEVDCDSLDIPEGFSPNSDGVNDYFVIDGLERYPDNQLKIFNRWGALVYEKIRYDNTWDGLSNVDLLRLGEVLPDGTYFYILETRSGDPARNGYVVLRR